MDAVSVINALCNLARPEILKAYRADSCIASTKIGIEVLKHFGIPAVPVSIETLIYNPAYCARIDAGQPHPETLDQLAVWTAADGSWNVGLGVGGDMNPGKWPGHLAIVADGKWLIDLSLDQACRPQHNIVLECYFLPADEYFLSGEESIFFKMNGCVLKVDVVEKGGFEKSNNWIDPSQSVIRSIINKMSEDLG